MRRCLARLVLLLVAPTLVAAALAAGYAQRPAADAAALQVYLLLGGDLADLCGEGHASGHEHCSGCQPPTLSLAGADDVPGCRPAPAASLGVRVAARTTEGIEFLGASPRGPPGRQVA